MRFFLGVFWGNLIRVWRRSADSGRTTNALPWVTTLTWTLVLKVYVPIDDFILVVRSVIATAGVLAGALGNAPIDLAPSRSG